MKCEKDMPPEWIMELLMFPTMSPRCKHYRGGVVSNHVLLPDGQFYSDCHYCCYSSENSIHWKKEKP
jgi:hypothetical protein